MTIRLTETDARGAGKPVLACDACGAERRPDPGRSAERQMRADAWSAGWRRHLTGGTWRDSCPDCVKRFAAERKAGGRLL